MKRVLIAGATGYLGGHLVAEWKRRGYWVRVLVRRREQAEALEADSVFVGQLTDPATMTGVADSVDTVISSIGITKPSGRFGYDQVDYGGNLTLLREAERSGATRFGYVSVFDGERLRDSVAMVAAKERFVDALAASNLATTVVRPTGFFSDIRAFMDMAAKGRSFLIGDGTRRINPISGRDLAVVCADAMESGAATLSVGGPEVFTHEEIARLATEIAGTSWRVTRLPPWLLRGVVKALRVVAPQRVWGALEFFAAAMTADMVAPAHGGDTLAEFFRDSHSGLPEPAAILSQRRDVDCRDGLCRTDRSPALRIARRRTGRGGVSRRQPRSRRHRRIQRRRCGGLLRGGRSRGTVFRHADDRGRRDRGGSRATRGWIAGVHVHHARLAALRRLDLWSVRTGGSSARRPVRSPRIGHGRRAARRHCPQADPEVVARLTREFLRVMGLLPVVIGRGEYALGVSGFGLLQGMLVQLLRQTTTACDPGGVLSLRPLITPYDYRSLASLPAVEADRESVIAAHVACAKQFVPLARRLHDECGLDWPREMVEALEIHLRKTLDVELPG